MISNFNKVIFIQKCFRMFVLLFLTFLFSSTTAFAYSPPFVCDQKLIIQGLLNNTSAYFLTEKDAKVFKGYSEENTGGCCFGLSSTWLYSKWLQFEHPEKVSRYHGNWFWATVKDILIGNLTNCDNIKKFSSLVITFQNSQNEWTFKKEMNKLDTNGNSFKKEYSIASLLTLSQLKQLLKEENIVRNHKLVLIFSFPKSIVTWRRTGILGLNFYPYVYNFAHCAAIFRDGDDYYYYDPNCPIGEIKATSAEDLASLIFRSNNYASTGKYSSIEAGQAEQLILNIFSFDKELSVYPNQQDVLNRINPSFVYKEKCGSWLLTAFYWGCLESWQYFFNKGVEFKLANRNYKITILELVHYMSDCKFYDKDTYVTPLMIASYYNYLDIIKILLESSNVDSRIADNNGYTAYLLAVQAGNFEAAKMILESQKTSHNMPTTDDDQKVLEMNAPEQ